MSQIIRKVVTTPLYLYQRKKVTMTHTHKISTFHIATANLDNRQISWEISKPSKRTKQQLSKLRGTAMLLAYQILKSDPTCTQSEAGKRAWALAKHYEGQSLIIDGVKVDGKTKLKRVVLDAWGTYNTIKGTGKPLKPGRKLFVDLAKLECNKPSTLSVLLSNVKIY